MTWPILTVETDDGEILENVEPHRLVAEMVLQNALYGSCVVRRNEDGMPVAVVRHPQSRPVDPKRKAEFHDFMLRMCEEAGVDPKIVGLA